MTIKTSTKYMLSGNKVLPYTHQEGTEADSVPAGYYVVKTHPIFGYHFLERTTEQVDLPKHIFGSAKERAARIFNAYNQQLSLGVGLFGKKGGGKSLLAMLLAHQTIEEGRPVIDVSDSFTTDQEYLDFLSSLQECTIIGDEFLKHLGNVSKSEDDVVTDKDKERFSTDQIVRMRQQKKQDKLLPFFQGVNNTKRLIVIIDNHSTGLGEFLRDRPGRLRYIFDYEGVEKQVVKELAEYYELSEEKVEPCIVYATRYQVSFDMIHEVIREWIEYPDLTIEQITEDLNVPTLRPVTTVKAKVTKFKHETSEGETAYTLGNELVNVDFQGCFTLELRVKNPHKGKPLMSDDDYYESEWSLVGYDRYKKYFDQDTIPYNIDFNESHITGIRGLTQVYRKNGISIEVEELNTVTRSVTDSWGSF